MIEKLPRGFVELANVPHHVHMTHVVAMPRIHSSTIRDDAFGHVIVLSNRLQIQKNFH
jgi:hypothetical protein